MNLDEDGKVKPYFTKVERIKQCETALEQIASGALTLQECITLAVSLRRTDNRWRDKSPRGYEAVKAAEEAEQAGTT